VAVRSSLAAAAATAPGRDAGLIALDWDHLEAGPSAIIGTRVRLTIVDGQIVFRSEELS